MSSPQTRRPLTSAQVSACGFVGVGRHEAPNPDVCTITVSTLCSRCACFDWATPQCAVFFPSSIVPRTLPMYLLPPLCLSATLMQTGVRPSCHPVRSTQWRPCGVRRQDFPACGSHQQHNRARLLQLDNPGGAVWRTMMCMPSLRTNLYVLHARRTREQCFPGSPPAAISVCCLRQSNPCHTHRLSCEAQVVIGWRHRNNILLVPRAFSHTRIAHVRVNKKALGTRAKQAAHQKACGKL